MDGFTLLLQELSGQNPAWKMGVMLKAMRGLGWSFDQAWSSAIQRMRVTPGMTSDEQADLEEWKAILVWCRPWYEWAFHGARGEPPSRREPPSEPRSERSREALRAVLSGSESGLAT